MELGGGAHLTYCTNVHPGERLSQVQANLSQHVARVRALVCPDRPFGVGLWLSAEAARELRAPRALAGFRERLAELGLYVFTLNGFPYGAFHGRVVKEAVYRPDWREDARRTYTDQLAELLCGLLPAGVDGSISSLPLAFKPTVHGTRDEQALAEQVLRHAAHLHALSERTGKRVTLALEPEPSCYLETGAEAIAFFDRHLRSSRALARLAVLAGTSRANAAEIVKRHLGLCLDACHAAVEFEDPAQLIADLAAAEIQVAKLQVSSGLRLREVDDSARAALAPYLDRVYLHQVVERRGDRLIRHLDLPDALRTLGAHTGRRREWRVHYHVPIFLERMRAFESTQFFVRELLALQRARPVSMHLEVETYTWDVLPDEARTGDLPAAIARELRFCLTELGVDLGA